MNNIKFLAASGEVIFENSSYISPISNILDIKNIFLLSKEKIRDSAPDFKIAGPLDVILWNRKFLMGLRLRKERIHSLTFTLADGKVNSLGYDAEESDLLEEKNFLRRLVEKNLNFKANNTTLGVDEFEFEWGKLTISASIKSTWCGIEVFYG